MEMLLGFLFMFVMLFGGGTVWGITRSVQRAHERALTREREKTERLRLRLQAQERADRIYLDSVQRHTAPPAPLEPHHRQE